MSFGRRSRSHPKYPGETSEIKQRRRRQWRGWSPPQPPPPLRRRRAEGNAATVPWCSTSWPSLTVSPPMPVDMGINVEYTQNEKLFTTNGFTSTLACPTTCRSGICQESSLCFGMRYIGSRTFTAQNYNSSRKYPLHLLRGGREGSPGKLEYLRRLPIAAGRGIRVKLFQYRWINEKSLTLHLVDSNGATPLPG